MIRSNLPLSKRLSRRHFVAALGAMGAVPMGRRVGWAQSQDDPPVFRTARHQFTLIRPSAELLPVDLSDLRGRVRPLAATHGRVLLINLWATWCEACRLDLPILERFHVTMGDRAAIVAVSMDGKGRAEVRRYLERLSVVQLPVLLDPDGHLATTSARGSAQLTAYALPITYLVGRTGRIEGYIAGAADWLSDDAQRLVAYYSSA
jgi:thiol-disulfide isomerase/thioredoxin